MILAALLASAVAHAPSARPVTTIILDQRDQCGIGRAAYNQRAQRRRKAEAIKREREARGETVRIVTIQPGVQLGGSPGPVVLNPAC